MVVLVQIAFRRFFRFGRGIDDATATATTVAGFAFNGCFSRSRCLTFFRLGGGNLIVLLQRFILGHIDRPLAVSTDGGLTDFLAVFVGYNNFSTRFTFTADGLVAFRGVIDGRSVRLRQVHGQGTGRVDGCIHGRTAGGPFHLRSCGQVLAIVVGIGKICTISRCHSDAVVCQILCTNGLR